MTIRFWRRKRILPFLYLNVSKNGMSLTFKMFSFNFTIPLKNWGKNKKKRNKRVSIGIPGTGIWFTKTLKKEK
jgi:hypothetical protein